MSDLHDQLKANRQNAMNDWSQLNHQVVGGKVIPMADHEKIELLKTEVVKLREELEKAKKEWNGCPCLYTTPCSEDCTCVKPWMSRGCSRCATYGSEEQKKAKAEWLAEILDKGKEAWSKQRTALAAAKEALRRIATHFPIDDGEEIPSLARQTCEQARDAIARIAECEKGT